MYCSQLWINRTCSVNLGFNDSICENLANYGNFSDEVQKQVTQYKVIGSYIETVPQIVLTLYLGKSISGEHRSMFTRCQCS